MITMTIVQSITITLAMVFQSFAPTAYQPGPPSLEETSTLLNVLNDIDTAWDDRLAAYTRLMQAEDAQSLYLLYSIIDAPVPASSAGFTSAPDDPKAVASASDVLNSSPGAPVIDFDRDRPPGVQVVWARKRLWDHWVRSLGPPDARAAIVAELLRNPATDLQRQFLVGATWSNWNDDIEWWMLTAFADQRARCDVRAQFALILMTQGGSSSTRSHLMDTVVNAAWQERGGSCGGRLAEIAAGHPHNNPRAVALTIDRYLAARARGPEDTREAAGLVGSLSYVTGMRTSEHFNVRYTEDRPVNSEAWRQEMIRRADLWVNENEAMYRARAEEM